MKVLSLKEIPVKGLTLDLSKREPWLMEILNTILSPYKPVDASIKGQIELNKFNDVVNMTGQLLFDFEPFCAHCGTPLKIRESVPLKATIAPLPADFAKQINDDEDEAELTADDMDFSFYEHDEIRIDNLVNDEVALAIQYNYYCKDKAACKLIKPLDPHITINDTTDPRWAALKDLKITKS